LTTEGEFQGVGVAQQKDWLPMSVIHIPTCDLC